MERFYAEDIKINMKSVSEPEVERRELSKDRTQRPKARSLTIALLRAREAVMSHFRPILAAHDVTEQQWRVLRVLSESGTLDATELAFNASILAPSLTRMIRSLQERGLVSKYRDRNDGRRIFLGITPAGERLIEEVMPQSLKVYAGLGARFGAERVEQLLDMLEQLSDLGLKEGEEKLENASADDGEI